MMKNTKKEVAQAAHRKAIRAALKLPAYSDARREAIATADRAYSTTINTK